MNTTNPIHEKIRELKNYIATFERLAIAYSGGVDSTFLLLVAKEVLGDDILAVTMSGPNFAEDEIQESKELCEKYDISQLMVTMPDEVFEQFAHNPEDRCYICKKGLFTHLKDCLYDAPLADGTNADDAKDYRPGRRALKELGIISPLEAIGFTKAEVREGLKAMNVSIWEKPAYACLATRIPYGEAITPAKLVAVYKVEKFIRELGFPQVRVRHHGKIAIVEIPPKQREDFAKGPILDAVNQKAMECGFEFATMDLAGYKMGKLNPQK